MQRSIPRRYLCVTPVPIFATRAHARLWDDRRMEYQPHCPCGLENRTEDVSNQDTRTVLPPRGHLRAEQIQGGPHMLNLLVERSTVQ
jgi:hypothetical protein